MSTARQHAEWLSLVEISGPFLSMPVLLRIFPQGLDAHDPDRARNLRLAYDEWEDNQGGLRPEPAIHRAWVRFVLGQTLELPDEVIAEGQTLPVGLEARIAEHGETLRPDLAIVAPPGLPDAGKARLLVQVYPPEQKLEQAVTGRLWKASPATRMMELLHAADVPLGLVTNGEHWMLVYAPRGETTGFASWYASLWLEETVTLRAFRSLVSAHRFFGVPEGETLGALLKESSQDQQEVTDRLGYQVRNAVEVLVQAIDRIDKDRNRSLLQGEDEKRLYEAALTVMMRLVFLFSAEERGLLLLGDPVYDQHYAVSTLRAQLREAADQHTEEVLERRHDAWSRLLAAFRAVYGGVRHERLSMLPYGGSLFDPDRFPFLEGREAGTSWQETPARPIPVNNRTVLHLPEALQILQVKVPGGGPAEARRLSFRALDIEQIGHVYEGLLDHTAVRAASPVLGLTGTKDREPEIALERLEAQRERGQDALLGFLKEETGRSESALKRALDGEGAAGGRRGRKTAPAGGTLFQGDQADQKPHPRLLTACDNEPALYERVVPFTGLLREDTAGCPVVINTGSVYVTQGTDRRTTGTHYTPRSLTETIVQHTLEPLVYDGPAGGKPKEEWRLRSARELLNLKVCDPAMGSGAFLVQACRYLSERLAEAWETAEKANPGKVVVTPEGDLSTGAPDERPLPREPEERLAIARRIVADHCMYGVDKNPAAVEMAKLSLWLITLAKGKPFTFLDHRLKHGDSLVGTIWWETNSGRMRPLPAEIPDAAYTTRSGEPEIVRDLRARNQGQLLLGDALPQTEDAAAYRSLSGYEDTPEGQRQKEEYYRRLHDGALPRRRRMAADLWCAAWFWPLTGTLGRLAPTTPLYRRVIEQGKGVPAELEVEVERLRERIPFLHWGLEFPEACAQGGFDAVVSNPPFLGGRYVSGQFGSDYLEHIKARIANDAKGNADMVVYFYLRTGAWLRDGGTAGMIGTKTVAEGDTHDVGLAQFGSYGLDIFSAENSRRWPGSASVRYVELHWTKGGWHGSRRLDGRIVSFIGSQLTGIPTMKPHKLIQSVVPYQGSYVHGMGFVLTAEERDRLISADPDSSACLYPCLSAEDFNTSPRMESSRFVIYFGDLDEQDARRFRKAWAHVEQHVKPERQALTDPVLSRYWWRFKRPTKPLYDAIWQQPRVLVCPVVTKHLSFAWVAPRQILLNKMYAFLGAGDSHYAVLQSTIYETWARYWSGSLDERLQFAPTDCFDNFVFPRPRPPVATGLIRCGVSYREHRASILETRQEGLTITYNRFHNRQETAEDIRRLRELHVEMDYAVAAAYRWTDLELGHGFHETKQGARYTFNDAARRDVLGRLLKLNHERYAEEVAQGLHGKGKGRKAKSGGSQEGGGDVELASARMDLFDTQLSLGGGA